MKVKLYTVHTNPDLADPADRTELVREGFSYVAFLLNIFWLLYQRLWIPALGYFALLAVLGGVAEKLGASPIRTAIAQLTLQLLLGFVAYDLKRWSLSRRGYRMAGVVAAENDLNAQRRYHDVLA